MNLRINIERDGYAVVPGVFPAEEIDQLILEINRAAPRRSKAGIRHALGIASVAAFAREPRLIQIARDVLGPTAFPFRATLFDKSPGSNWLVVWHQDTALPLQERQDLLGWGPWSVKEGVPYAHAPASALRQVLTLRVHLDDSTVSNGPLRVLLGTHRENVLNDDAIHELAAQIAPIECVAAKGGVVAMSPLIVHASSKSYAETPRRVMHIEYAAAASIAGPLRLAIA
jgi:ectoine hydroxylase-related dioxygenase (phytanoyl-CoA dioxygenase family)